MNDEGPNRGRQEGGALDLEAATSVPSQRRHNLESGLLP